MIFQEPDYCNFTPHIERRKKLLETIKHEYPDITSGVVTLFADFESERSAFRQDSSFYYFTGITEPGVVLLLDLEGKATLYVPGYQNNRAQWVASPVELIQDNADTLGIDEIAALGKQCAGYQIHPFFSQPEYENVLSYFQDVVASNGTVFTLNPNNTNEYIQQRSVLERINAFIPGFKNHTTDISAIVAQMRRKKDRGEIEQLFKAIDITNIAHNAAATAIAPQASESEVQARLEYVFTCTGARTAFPSIVASGSNATILHYTDNKRMMQEGELVVIDIGAEYGYYCADITRTYPVSGTFTKRQRELYEIVLDTQEYIESVAKVGYWLFNAEHPDKSLHHLAKKYLEERGYAQYFTHGIGHFLGLDVHDVGDRNMQLQEGDIITIEPGIYIPEEQIGIRIEDDFWILNEGAVRLSSELPRSVEEIEAMMQQPLPGSDDHVLDENVDYDDAELMDG